MRLLSLLGVCVLCCAACARIPEQPGNLPPARFADPSQTKGGHETKETLSQGDAVAIRRELEAGNRRFIVGRSERPRQSVGRRVELEGGQKPHTIVLSCSDSRVPPEVIFDQGLGDLFVVRTAGEVADAAAVASIEYAVEHLGVKMLVIMGHQSCGAVKATLATPPGKSAGSADLNTLVNMIRPNLRGLSSLELDPKSDSTLTAAGKAQVLGTKMYLLKRSKIVNEAVHLHGLQILPAIYHLESGEVEFF